MNLSTHFAGWASCICLCAFANIHASGALAGDYTTLTVNSSPTNGPVVLTNSIEITSNQVAQLVAVGGQLHSLDVILHGLTYTYSELALQHSWPELITVAGPATLRLRVPADAYLGAAYFTVRITPEIFSPEKTILVTPSNGGTTVSLESSTNLKEWQMATNGIYAETNLARFFRINLNRAAFTPPFPPDGSVVKQVDGHTKTIFVKSASGRTSDQVSINEYQTAEIVAVGKQKAFLDLWRGNQRFPLTGVSGNGIPWWGASETAWKSWSPVRGPATFQLTGGYSDEGESFCTIRVFTEQYPPDKTLIMLPGTNSYTVALESSTDLSSWSVTTNGIYTVPQALFFRIHSEINPNN